MALMSPATTEADVDRHTEVFAEAARELTGLARDDAARVPGARVEVERAVRLAEQPKALARIASCCSGVSVARYAPAGPTAKVNGSQKSSKSS